MRKLVGTNIQFPVRERLLAETQRRMVRSAPDLVFEQFVNAFLGVGHRTLIEGPNYVLVVPLAQHWQGIHLRIRICCHSGQKGRVSTPHPLSGLTREVLWVI